MIQFVLISDYWKILCQQFQFLSCVSLTCQPAGGEDFVQAQCGDLRDGDAPHWQALFHSWKGVMI